MIPLLGLALEAVPALVRLFDDDAGAATEKVTSIVSNVLGTSDVEEARKQLANNPELMIKLKESLYAYQTRMAEEETKRLQSINQTMQTEAISKNWWSSAWRPFWGFISALAFAGVCFLIGLLAWSAIAGGKPEAMSMIPPLIGQFAMLFGIPGAILGVASWHRGKQQRIQAGER